VIIDEIWEFEGGPIAYQARGHVDIDAFIAALQTQHDRMTDSECVHHKLVRNVPVSPDDFCGGLVGAGFGVP